MTIVAESKVKQLRTRRKKVFRKHVLLLAGLRKSSKQLPSNEVMETWGREKDVKGCVCVGGKGVWGGGGGENINYKTVAMDDF